MKLAKNPLFYLNLFLVFVVVFQMAGFVYAWSEPGAAFPGGAPAAPLDTGPGAQTKSGGLTLNKLDFVATGGNGICLLDSARAAGTSCKLYWNQISGAWS